MNPVSQPAPRIRVLHIDDSAVMRSLIRMVLEPEHSIEIAGTASSGEDGVAASVVWGMPGAVAHAGLATKILPLEAISTEILRLTSSTNSPAPRVEVLAR